MFDHSSSLQSSSLSEHPYVFTTGCSTAFFHRTSSPNNTYVRSTEGSETGSLPLRSRIDCDRKGGIIADLFAESRRYHPAHLTGIRKRLLADHRLGRRPKQVMRPGENAADHDRFGIQHVDQDRKPLAEQFTAGTVYLQRRRSPCRAASATLRAVMPSSEAGSGQ